MSTLNIVEKVIALEGVEVFADLTPDQLALIGSIATDVRFTPGQSIFDDSKRIDGLYVIIDGGVELRHGEEPLTKAGRDYVLGSWALFEDTHPVHVTAKALEDTRLLRIGREDFLELLADHMEMTAVMFSSLAKRLRTSHDTVKAGGAR